MHSQHIQFAILDFDPSVLQIDLACTKALDLCTDKCNSGLQRFQNKVIMARLAVDGDGFYAFRLCRMKRLLCCSSEYKNIAIERSCQCPGVRVRPGSPKTVPM